MKNAYDQVSSGNTVINMAGFTILPISLGAWMPHDILTIEVIIYLKAIIKVQVTDRAPENF